MRSQSDSAEQNFPATLTELPPDLVVNLKDPVTKTTYEYRPTSPTTFELCATFATASAADHFDSRLRPTRWDHPQGRHCYELDTRDPNVLLTRREPLRKELCFRINLC